MFDDTPSTALAHLIASEHVSPATRRALESRLSPPRPPDPPLFTEDQRATLTSLAARLLPTPHPTPQDLALTLEANYATSPGKGWRHAALPDDLTCVRLLIDTLAAAALNHHLQPFDRLLPDDQDSLIHRLQSGALHPATLSESDTAHAFTALLVALTELTMADPSFQLTIGYVGFADLPRWDGIGLDELDDRELPTPDG